ncbi:MAG: hypothetical protein ACRDJU_06315 [Actinomycetota bacterium]
MSTEMETLLADSLEALVAGQPFTPDLAAVERRGRQLRRRANALRAVTAGGVATALATVAVVAAGGGRVSFTTKPTTAAAGPAVLYRLASVSAAVPALQGRYVVLTETDTHSPLGSTSQRTTVIDTETGASTTYQQVAANGQAPAGIYLIQPSAPPIVTGDPDPTSTEAWFAALPTDPTALRAQLLSIAKQAAPGAGTDAAGKVVPSAIQPALSDDDYVYDEASDLLWSPLVQPALRSALYQVLAQTPGVSVNPNATDPSGRAAIAMTRSGDSAAVEAGYQVRLTTGQPATDTTYEDPSTGAVLAQVWSVNHDTLTAVYQPVTGSATLPADPYFTG